MSRKPDATDPGEIAQELIRQVRSGKGLTQQQLVERAEEALESRIDEFEREAQDAVDAMPRASIEDVLAAAEALRSSSLLYRYDLLGVLAGSLAVWCSDYADDARWARAVIAHADAMTTVLRARMRGERPVEREALLAGLEATLRDA